jgi:hypothetical protein
VLLALQQMDFHMKEMNAMANDVNKVAMTVF